MKQEAELTFIGNELRDMITGQENNISSLMIYGSFGRLWNFLHTGDKRYNYGHPTNSSDIDSVVFRTKGNRNPYKCFELMERIISLEQREETDAEMSKLEHRLIDGWIVFDESKKLTLSRESALNSFFAEKAIEERISDNYCKLNLAIEACNQAFKLNDLRSLSYFLRDVIEFGYKVITENAQRTPTLRRLFSNLHDLDPYAVDILMNINGGSKVTNTWVDSAVKALSTVQSIMWKVQLSEQDSYDKDILSPILVKDYQMGSYELAAEDNLSFAIFPAMLYVSMILHRRNPAIKSLIKHSGNDENILRSPTIIREIEKIGLDDKFFDAFDIIFGVEKFSVSEYRERIELCADFRTYLADQYMVDS